MEPDTIDQMSEAELRTELRTLVAENIHLRAANDKRVEDFLAERVCCSGQDCGCMGVTRREQMVQEEAGARITAVRSALLRTTGSLGLIIKGARADGPGHKENYDNAKQVLDETF